MRKNLILSVIAVLIASILFAQSSTTKLKIMRNVRPGTFTSANRPTQVTGEGVITSSGLRYWEIVTGKGEPATKGHAVSILYRGWVENGKEFASSISDGKPIIFTLGAGQVIPGWEEGIEGMKVGGRRQLKIPPNLASGTSEVRPLVPPNATLIFDVELLELQ